MDKFQDVQQYLARNSHRWLVTGAAGFIGSNLVEALLRLNQRVVGLDNFATGQRRNLEQVRAAVGAAAWERFELVEGDIRQAQDCAAACGGNGAGVEYVLHQAALGSVARSFDDPVATNATNVDGFLQVLVAARDAGVRRVVYAASSASYGDQQDLPKAEDRIGEPLSPYAVSKYVGELYANVFGRSYGLETIGLRYFNVFGPRQNPEGVGAAVIARWARALIRNDALYINGDGETSRDFCFVDNVVQANILAALADGEAAGQVFNVALGERTSLNALYGMMRDALAQRFPHVGAHRPQYAEFRRGDVRHSQANIGKATALLGYRPTHRIEAGLKQTMDWYVRHLAQ
ncbi:SDR family oxidoreductase [Massilia sp.]|uniref:SDR family oxidoreductase n=1 Tax=Massilia sp. TaxID=1882437 RepID=UPI0028A2507D|nr:SDR family oxidoreductase [Massilia sp.]